MIKPVGAAVQTIYPIADTYVDSDHPSSNYGGGTYLDTYFWDYNYIDDIKRNTYIKFDLSPYTPGIHNMSSATLRLYAWYVSGPTAHVAVCDCSGVSWREFEITWQNAPSFILVACGTTTIAIEDSWYSWDVTDLVKNNLGRNMTLVLTVTDVEESYSISYRSRQSSSNAPELLIEYSIIPEFPSFLILPLFMIATLLAVIAYRRRKVRCEAKI
jgi:hypothetical protein